MSTFNQKITVEFAVLALQNAASKGEINYKDSLNYLLQFGGVEISTGLFEFKDQDWKIEILHEKGNDYCILWRLMK